MVLAVRAVGCAHLPALGMLREARIAGGAGRTVPYRPLEA